MYLIQIPWKYILIKQYSLFPVPFSISIVKRLNFQEPVKIHNTKFQQKSWIKYL